MRQCPPARTNKLGRAFRSETSTTPGLDRLSIFKTATPCRLQESCWEKLSGEDYKPAGEIMIALLTIFSVGWHRSLLQIGNRGGVLSKIGVVCYWWVRIESAA
jgi:hypothetical protein